jgi:hypothetical protein
MNRQILDWMNQRYPGGFYCAEVTNPFQLPISAMLNLNMPIVLQIAKNQLQDLVVLLFEQGASPQLNCHIPDLNISATLRDVALRTRPLEEQQFFLVLTE